MRADNKGISEEHSADARAQVASVIVDAYAGQLMPNAMVETFQTAETAFATRLIRREGETKPLQYSDQPLRNYPIASGDNIYDLFDYVSRNRVAGLIVAHKAKVVLEHYDLGITPDTRWMSMSMAKSVSTTLVGAAIKDGYITDVNDPLTKYLPDLSTSAYHETSVRELLQMTSGVHWDDTHTDPTSERRKMLEMQVQQQPGAIVSYVASQPREVPSGQRWNYSTGETHLVGALVQAATGKWLSDYLSEKIWQKLGMEHDAYWWLESVDGLEVAGSGICATLRDYLRYAQFMATGGIIDGERILPETWVAEATAPRKIGEQTVDYGYMWWPVRSSDHGWADGAYAARGIFGQFMYINPAKEVTIVVLSARSKPKGAEVIIDNDFFNATVAALT
jgi:CubicO group peptidase (beta-lactamase class C family)